VQGDGQYGNPSARQAEVDVVRAVYAAFARRDLEAALEHLAEGVEFVPAGTASLIGRSAPYTGHDGVREYFADAARMWDDLTLHADDFRVSVGSVVVFGRIEGVVARTGERFEASAVWVWQVRDGKATSMRATSLGAAAPAPADRSG
jgi:ketosteroid isomerase-like protein